MDELEKNMDKIEELVIEAENDERSREEILEELREFCEEEDCSESNEVMVKDSSGLAKTGLVLAVAGGAVGGGIMLYKKVIKPKIIPAIKKKRAWRKAKKEAVENAKAKFEDEYLDAEEVKNVNFKESSPDVVEDVEAEEE